MESPASQLVIIGSIHGSHNRNPRYGPDALGDILVSLRPAAICVELYAALFDSDGAIRQEVLADTDFPENAAASRAADALDVRLFPIDREDRNEYYARIGFHEREDRASARLQRWLSMLSRARSESVDLRIGRLAQETAECQLELDRGAPAAIINSAAYDRLIRTKHLLWDDVLPRLMAAHDGYRDAVADAEFFRDEWRERNAIMARNIAHIADRFRSARIAVVTGAEHRYALRDALSGRADIELREFWEVLRPSSGLA